jgi:hypothetical protein
VIDHKPARLSVLQHLLTKEEYTRLAATERESEQALAEMRAFLAAEAAAGDVESAAILERWIDLEATIAARRAQRTAGQESE